MTAPPKRRPGRPRGEETVNIQVKITPDQRAFLDRRAADTGQTVSAVVRAILAKVTGR